MQLLIISDISIFDLRLTNMPWLKHFILAPLHVSIFCQKKHDQFESKRHLRNTALVRGWFLLGFLGASTPTHQGDIEGRQPS